MQATQAQEPEELTIPTEEGALGLPWLTPAAEDELLLQIAEHVQEELIARCGDLLDEPTQVQFVQLLTACSDEESDANIEALDAFVLRYVPGFEEIRQEIVLKALSEAKALAANF